MSKAVLNEIQISNFKIISDTVTIPLHECNLAVLDGPNGFGKTTIFDSIEILLTGKLSRIVNIEYRAQDKPILYANDINQPIVLKAEFILEDKSKYWIMRKIDNPKVGGKIELLDNAFCLYRLEAMNDENGEIITQDILNKKIGLDSGEVAYRMMNYIPQEDTFKFLKNGEKARMEKINQLFDIEKTKLKYTELKEKRLYINKLYEKLKGNKSSMGKINSLKEELKNLENQATEAIEEHQYKKLISWKNIYWDLKDIAISEENFTRIIGELKELKDFLDNYTYYFDDLRNTSINTLCSVENMSQIKVILQIGGHFDAIEAFKSTYKTIKLQMDELENIKKDNYLAVFKGKNYLINDWSFLSTEEVDDLNRIIKNCKQLNEELGVKKSVYAELLQMRESLLAKYREFTNDELEKKDCPFCGTNLSIEGKTLLEEFNRKTDLLKESSSLYETELDKEYKSFKETYKVRIITELEKLINDSNFDYAIYEKLIEEEKNIESYNKIIKLLKRILPSFNKDFLDGKTFVENERVELRYKKLIDALENELIDVADEYYDLESRDKFREIFKNIFESEKSKLENINVDDVIGKTQYIQYKYYDSVNIKKMSITSKIEDFEDASKTLFDVKKEIEKVEKVYKANIDSYFSDMIKNLEIPFYLYTGRVLQDYNEGLGVFIKAKEGTDLKTIKFVSDNSSEHDLLNKFSSGQLTSVILSLLLSMNSMFSEEGLNMLLIDDPVQTMDEINIFGLVDLLRNEFSEKQLILSTHEDEISRYLRYKFKKSGAKTLNIDVRETLHERVFNEIV